MGHFEMNQYRWVFLLPVFFLSGCTHLWLLCCDYDYGVKLVDDAASKVLLTSRFKVQRRASVVLDDSSQVYAAFSQSEAWVTADVPLASQLCRAVGQVFVSTQCALDVETLAQAQASARERGSDYLFYPRVQHWGDRVDSGPELNDQWQEGIGDRAWGLDDMVVDIVILDVASSRHVDTLTVSGRGGLANWGRHSPADMLGEALTEVFAVLIQRPVQ